MSRNPASLATGIVVYNFKKLEPSKAIGIKKILHQSKAKQLLRCALCMHCKVSEEAAPADGGQLSLLLHLLREDLELLLEGFLVVVGVDVVIVGHYWRQELGAGEAEQLLKHLQVSKVEKR